MSDVRDFESILGAELLEHVQSGVMRTVYRGVPMLKSPFDIVLYLQLLQRLKPATIIEIGTRFGGSALWFADALSNHGIVNGRVISIDIKPPASLQDSRITLLRGEARKLEEVVTKKLLQGCSRPFLVVEDSSHRYEDVVGVLTFFHEKLTPGDYIVVEDGVVSHMRGEPYASYEDGPNRAVAAFLRQHPKCYEIDLALCDHFGRNATYNPNGWLKRL